MGTDSFLSKSNHVESTSRVFSYRCKTKGVFSNAETASSTAAAQSAWGKSLPKKTPRAPQAFSEKPETFKINSRSRWERVFNWRQSVKSKCGIAACGGSG